MKCIVVDDEPLALDLLEDNVRHVPYLELVGKCKNAFEAMELLGRGDIDLMFLDIQMPGLTGLQFLKTLEQKRPMVVFVTAFEQFAVQGYELNVLDYLVKPVSLERFVAACQKAQHLYQLQHKPSSERASAEPTHFFVHSEYSLVKIVVQDIQYIEAMKDYVKIYCKGQTKPIISRISLKGIEEKLPEELFLKVHKSFIVRLDSVNSIRNGVLSIDGQEVPVSDPFKEIVMRRLGI